MAAMQMPALASAPLKAPACARPIGLRSFGEEVVACKNDMAPSRGVAPPDNDIDKTYIVAF
jgi:hypothetical protein